MKTSEILGTRDISVIVEFVEDFVGFKGWDVGAESDVVDIIEHGEWDGQDLVYVSNQNRACYRAAGEENGYWFDADSLGMARQLVLSNEYMK